MAMLNRGYVVYEDLDGKSVIVTSVTDTHLQYVGEVTKFKHSVEPNLFCEVAKENDVKAIVKATEKFIKEYGATAEKMKLDPTVMLLVVYYSDWPYGAHSVQLNNLAYFADEIVKKICGMYSLGLPYSFPQPGKQDEWNRHICGISLIHQHKLAEEGDDEEAKEVSRRMLRRALGIEKKCGYNECEGYEKGYGKYGNV
jgi:hypothetical protein